MCMCIASMLKFRSTEYESVLRMSIVSLDNSDFDAVYYKMAMIDHSLYGVLSR
jgi:hypothetical protein